MVAQKLLVFRRFLMVACMTVLVFSAALIMPTIQCAEADWSTVTESGSYGPDDIGNYTINVNQFNPALGTLEEATFTITGNLTGTFSFTNNDGAGKFYYWGQTGEAKISYGSMNFDQTVSSGYDPNFNTSNMNKVGPFASGQTITGNTINMGNPSQTFTFTAPGDLSAFIGNGTLPFSLVATQSNVQVAGGGNFTARIDTLASGTVTAQYEYASVPIPASIFLFAPGLLGLAAVRRRFQKVG